MNLPEHIRKVLPKDTADSWEALVPVLPPDIYLAGGTALAVHLQHRVSRDLDFFFHADAVDLSELESKVADVGPFAVTSRAPGTLNGLFSQTKVQFLHCDETDAQTLLEPPRVIAGLHVAGIPDIFAMKLKVIADRGELRDYFDLMKIEQQTGLRAEEGIGFFLSRFRRSPDNQVLLPVLSALGYLDDVDEGDSLPVKKATIDAYWRKRQPEVARHLQRFGV
ncbi:MAG: nucleotidyl transferase AbiEii/AbiGii toxin family protein [Solirubrobacterales bacterium]|nr:nucleotidyl transferase AbiEii/AbiGii toxin family protein [Solirubrobacterales bacterium]